MKGSSKRHAYTPRKNSITVDNSMTKPVDNLKLQHIV